MKKWILIIVTVTAVVGIVDFCSSSRTYPEIINEAVHSGDFQTANKKLVEWYDGKGNPSPWWCAETWVPVATRVLKAEASWLMDHDDEEVTRLFMLCANDVASNIGNQQVTVGRNDGNQYFDTKHYIDEVTPYNQALLSIIREACIKDKRDFARKVAKMLKPNYKKDREEKVGDKNIYYISPDNSAVTEAQNIIATQY